MPNELPNLPVQMAAVSESQLLQQAFQAQERAMTQAAATHTQDQAKQEATEQVQTTKEVENPTIESDRKGARSFNLQERKQNKEDPKPAVSEVIPPDPEGRGRVLDVQL